MSHFNFILEFTKDSGAREFSGTHTRRPKITVPFPKPGIGKFEISNKPFAKDETYVFSEIVHGVEMVGPEGKNPRLPTVEEIQLFREFDIEDEFPEDLTKPITYVGPVNDDPYNFIFKLKKEAEGGGKTDQIKKHRKTKYKKYKRKKSKRKKSKSKTRRRRR